MGDDLTRRDFIIRGTILASILGGLLQLDGKDVSEDERDVAKEAMAIFIGSFPAGQDPEPNQVADKGRLAIRAWRELKRSG
jgi:hypothetical protein